MSHFTKLDKSNIVDPKAFIAAAKELGFTTIKENATMNGYMGRTMKADIVAQQPGGRYDVGLVKNGSKYDLIADWWGVGNLQGTSGSDAFLRLTTKHTLINRYRMQGFTARIQEDAAHNITVSLTR